MIRSFVTLTGNPQLVAAAALVIKASLVLTGGALVAALMRNRPAAARHLVWVFASAGAVVVAAIAPFAPNVSMPLIEWAPPRNAAIATASSTAPGGFSIAALEEPGRGEAGGGSRSSDGTRGGELPSATASGRPSLTTTLLPPAFLASRLAFWGRTHPGAAILAGVWLAGSAAVFLWILLGHLGLARMVPSAIPTRGDEWRALLAEAVKRNGVTRAVRLGLSPSAGGPITWGWLHPVVLFPAAAASWPLEQRRAALMHEMAHVARYDYLTQLIASIACCAYWFNPLAWLAARRLRSESELACDDRVLAGGTTPTDYAAQLLGVAQQARELRLGGFVAVSMARPSHLEGRLLAVLDANRPRGVTSPRMRLATTIGFGMLLIPLAGLRPVPATGAASSGSVAKSERSTTTFAPTSDTQATGMARRSSELGGVRREAANGTNGGSIELGAARWEAAGGTNADSTTEVKSSSRVPAALQPAARTFQDSSFEKTERAVPGEQLYLDLRTGGSVEIRGSEEALVRVRVQLGGADWEDTRVEVGRMEEGVRVRSAQEGGSRSYSTSHKFVVTVPKRFDVRLKSSGGNLTIVGVEGSFRGNTGGGEIVMKQVTGRASLSTGGGDIDVSDSDVSGSVSTGGGMVMLSRVRGGLRGSSGSGPVISGDGTDAAKKDEMDKLHGDLSGVTVNKDREKIEDARAAGSGMLHVRKAGGPIALGEAPHGATISTGGGDIRVGRGAGMVDAHTGGGDIQIGPVAGSVRAGTGAGEVHITLIDASGVEQSVEVESGTGRVIVELPASFDGRIELETAYTRSFGRATRIESPWDLERQETTEWESNRGTPRRFVRGRGTAGSGRGLVRINTVNGDIILRRGR